MGFVSPGDYPSVDMLPGVVRRLIATGERTMAMQFELARGATIPPHSHPHEQIGFLVSGAMQLTIGGEMKLISEGGAYVIPPNSIHSVAAAEQCIVIDLFSPPREDYL